MLFQSFRKAFVACAVFWALTLCLNAQQQGQPPQGGGQQPNPQPQPTPQPQPRPTPTPAPTIPTQNQNLSIRGRIIIDAHTSFQMTEVRFETDGGQPIGFAYADSGGEFNFQRTGFSSDQNLYVVVKMDGYKPYRERIGGAFGMNSFDGLLTIFMEREATVLVPGKGGPAVVDLKQLRAKIPGKAVDEYEKALKESSKGNRAKAVEGLQKAVKLAPDFYEAQHTLGVQFMAMQKFEDAETALLRARDLSPKAAEPLINLGSLYYQRGEGQSDAGHAEDAAGTFRKAVDCLEESIKRNPLSTSAHSYLGAALYKLAVYDRAETILNHALELDENQSDARLMLINVYTKQARYGDALKQTNTFLEKNPKAPQRPSLENIKQQIEKVLAGQK